MEINKACSHILAQLTHLVNQLSEQDFIKPVNALGGATLGQHLRHTLEFFVCLENGLDTGVVNYDKRAHDKAMETGKRVALSVLYKVNAFIESNKIDKKLKLEAMYDVNTETVVTIDTSYSRELVYNMEHAVHHMAIMKIGLREVAPYVKLAHNFGVAAATVRYRESTAVQ